VTPDELSVVLREGESGHVEFKKTAAKPQVVAQVLAGFANADGGLLVIGVDERAGVLGVSDPERADADVREAARLVEPPLDVIPEHVVVGDRTVITVTVPKGDRRPYLADGLAAQRVGTKLVRLSGKDLVAMLGTSAEPEPVQLRRLADLVASQGAQLSAVRKSLSLSRQIALIVFGTGLGAAVTLLIDALR
jgi:predicted HTH transcriptional regulator